VASGSGSSTFSTSSSLRGSQHRLSRGWRRRSSPSHAFILRPSRLAATARPNEPAAMKRSPDPNPVRALQKGQAGRKAPPNFW
jgi:hypothetical protein